MRTLDGSGSRLQVSLAGPHEVSAILALNGFGTFTVVATVAGLDGFRCAYVPIAMAAWSMAVCLGVAALITVFGSTLGVPVSIDGLWPLASFRVTQGERSCPSMPC